MLLNKVEPQSSQGNILPQDAQGVYHADFNNNLSQLIDMVSGIDDEGSPQDIRMTTTILDEDFYEYAGGTDKFELTQSFNTGDIPPQRIRLLRKPQGGVMIPCRIRTTIFYTTVVAGVKKKQQKSLRTFIQ